MPDWLTIINLGYVTMICKAVSSVDSNIQCQQHRPDSCPANKIFEENKHQIVIKNINCGATLNVMELNTCLWQNHKAIKKLKKVSEDRKNWKNWTWEKFKLVSVPER